MRALERLGVEPSTRHGGAHQLYVRESESGRRLQVAVPIGRGEVSRETLRYILRRLEISLDQFKEASG